MWQKSSSETCKYWKYEQRTRYTFIKIVSFLSKTTDIPDFYNTHQNLLGWVLVFNEM